MEEGNEGKKERVRKRRRVEREGKRGLTDVEANDGG